MHCKPNLTREGEADLFKGWGWKWRGKYAPEAWCVTRRLSGAKAAAVKYVCGDAQKIHPPVDQNPDSLVIIPFLPSRWSSSLRALLFFPPRKCQPLRLSAPKQIAASEPPKLTAWAARTDIRFYYNMPPNARTHIGLRCSRRINYAQTGTKGEESRRGIDGIVSVAFASRENSCLSGLPWFGHLMQGGWGVAVWSVANSTRTRKRTRFHLLPVCLSTNSSSLPTQAQWRNVMKRSKRFFAAGPVCSGSVPIEGFKNVDSRVNYC